MKINRTEEFDLAYRFVTETNLNIFLTGKAGTGKTTFLKYLQKNSTKKMLVAAPTGVAAVNAAGVTLHSLFQLPLGIILPYTNTVNPSKDLFKDHPLLSRIHYSKEKLNLLRSIELLIIDEASMLASYIVDAIDIILRYVKRKPEEAFGGVQILFIGDLNQLPPVVKNEDWEILSDYYSSIFFFDSIVLSENIPVIIELKNIYRQKDNKFIEILGEIRNNELTEENYNLLNSRLIRNFTPSDGEGYISLTTHNYQADEINKTKLKNLPSPEYIFSAEIIDEFPENILPAEKELILKKGAQVMFLKNDTEAKQYFNGKIGMVTELDWDFIKVFCRDDQLEIIVKKSEWQNIRFKVDPETRKIKEEVLGSFIQYPLRLAWAITIHKSQGLTFDRVIINAERAFAAGQVYVALSRCTSLNGLVLSSPVRRNSIISHKELNEWFIRNKDINLQMQFIEARQNYILRELKDIFDNQKLYNSLKDLKAFFEENKSDLSAESLSWLEELIFRQKQLNETSEKFMMSLVHLGAIGSDIENNDQIQKRIKEAAYYFYNEIEAWKKSFINHPLRVHTKKVSSKADKLLFEINLILSETLTNLHCCKNGFMLKDYLMNKNSLRLPSFELGSVIKSSYTKDKSSKKDTVKETVKLFKEGKSADQIAAERNLVISTIEGHFAQAIKQGLIDIEEVMSISEAKMIAEYFPKNLKDVGLSSIKETVPQNISYGKLKIVLAWLDKMRKQFDN